MGGKGLGRIWCRAEGRFGTKGVSSSVLESQRQRKVLSSRKLKSSLNHRISGIELGLPLLALRVIFWCVVCFLYCELVCLFFFYVAQLCNNVLMFFLFKSPEIFNWFTKQQQWALDCRYTKMSFIVPTEIAPPINVFFYPCFRYIFNLCNSFCSSL